jgi:hypothetical protein
MNTRLPVDKYDVLAVERLILAGPESALPHLAELLTWMQDLNWPVAQALQPFLAKIGLPLEPHIREVLASDDDGWKFWTLSAIVGESPALMQAFEPELRRMASSPTPGERLEGAQERAQDILERL